LCERFRRAAADQGRAERERSAGAAPPVSHRRRSPEGHRRCRRMVRKGPSAVIRRSSFGRILDPGDSGGGSRRRFDRSPVRATAAAPGEAPRAAAGADERASSTRTRLVLQGARMKAIPVAVAVAAAFAATAEPAHAQRGADACAALENLTLPDTIALDAERVPAGPFSVETGGAGPQTVTGEVPSFCRVRGTVAPAIRFEVWLPDAADWNGRFQAVGGGGFAGVISYGAMLPNIQRGYVTASTDTGHVASDLEWLADE